MTTDLPPTTAIRSCLEYCARQFRWEFSQSFVIDAETQLQTILDTLTKVLTRNAELETNLSHGVVIPDLKARRYTDDDKIAIFNDIFGTEYDYKWRPQ